MGDNMTLAELRKFARLYIPSLKGSKFDNDDLDIILKKAVIEISKEILPLKTEKKFNISEGQASYKITDIATDFLSIDRSGVWYLSGTKYKRLDPVTEKWLDNNIENWRDLEQGTPERYTYDGEQITLHPTPDTTTTDGGWLYYGRKPQEMNAATDYPFEGATLMPHLDNLDDTILLYVKWKLMPVVGDQILENPYQKDYEIDLVRKKRQINRRLDIKSFDKYGRKNTRLRGRRVC